MKLSAKKEKLLILCILLFMSIIAKGQDAKYSINYINVSDGLSQNEVTSIIEDKYGFIWFATRGGLNRYDGYDMKQFKPGRDAHSSIQNPSIERIMSDESGRIWIGYKSGGFSRYDPKYESFIHSDSILANGPDRPISFFEDFNGKYWIGGFGSGLTIYNPQTGESANHFRNNDIRVFVQTPDSTIWFGTSNDIIYQKKGEDFKNFNFNSSFSVITDIITDHKDSCLWIVGWGRQLTRLNYSDLSFNVFNLPSNGELPINTYAVEMDQNGTILVGTWGNGLFSFDKDTEQFTKIDFHPERNHFMKKDYDIILDIYEDSNGIIWLGTDGAGVVSLSPTNGFKTIAPISGNYKLHVNSIFEKPDGTLLVGTKEQGAYKLIKDDEFIQLDVFINNKADGVRKHQTVNCFFEGPDGRIWVGMGNALYVYRNSDGTQNGLVLASEFYASPDLNIPRKILSVLTRNDEIWIATQQQGLFLYKKNKGVYTFVNRYAKSGSEGKIANNRISVLFLDKNNDLWAGTYDGLFKYNGADSVFVSLESLIAGGTGSICNIILCATVDQQGEIWYGTPCSLNNLKEVKDGTFTLKEFTKKDGLMDDYICDIIEDKAGILWVSTSTGILKYDKEEEQFQNFEVGDAYSTYNFSESSGFKSKSGEIYFGGFSGITHFYPDDIHQINISAPLVFTNIKVMNSEVEVSQDGFLPISINEIEELIMTHKEKEVMLEFSSLDYRSPHRNLYAYNLQRSNEKSEMIYLGNKRNISLQNLKPGRYMLNVRGSNSNGVWDKQGKTIELFVKPPPWKSLWAISAYLVFIFLIVILIILVSLKQERLKAKANLEHLQYEKEKELNEYKLQFFTNISHEFRTPLTLILAPLSELMKMNLEDVSKDISRKVKTIYRNTDRLLKLVNQFLEFRKIQVGKARLECSEQNMISFIKEIIQPFYDLATQKCIQFDTKFNAQVSRIYFDGMKMSVVFNNLLSNALKYCGDPGKIWVEISEGPTDISILIGNDGPGILPKDQEHIFDRFNMTSSRRFHDSSGIGLALVKNYVELHHGTITVESKTNEHTQFIVRLAKGKDHLKPEDIKQLSQQIQLEESIVANFDFAEKKTKFHHQGTGGSRILIVEDNLEMQEYISTVLSPYYTILSAFNGQEGFDMAIVELPDLIISDVMMPEMDGFEMCKKIKNNEKLLHIPVILLTARDDIADKIFGVKKGADDYITKPFEPEFLLERILQILKSRSVLAKKYSKKVTLEPTNKQISSQSEKILNKAIKTIEENISSQELNLDFLASELAMSPTTLYRKMKSLCGQSPGEFIKAIRFKRAAQLLQDTDLTISEIIEMVGYQDYKRFRDTFKSIHNMTPGDFRKGNKN